MCRSTRSGFRWVERDRRTLRRLCEGENSREDSRPRVRFARWTAGGGYPHIDLSLRAAFHLLLDFVHATGWCFCCAGDSARALSAMPHREDLSAIAVAVSGNV